jgi:uncharacterized membrane protein
MQSRQPRPVEDYTNANLILVFVNLLWIFVAMWSAWGLLPVLLLALGLNQGITWLERTRRLREEQAERRASGADRA